MKLNDLITESVPPIQELRANIIGKTKVEVTKYLKELGYKKFRAPMQQKDEASYMTGGFPAYISVNFLPDMKAYKVWTTGR